HEEVAGRLVVLLHGHRVGTRSVRDPGELPALFPEADLIVHGHTHEAAWHRVDGTWVLNPGSAGPGGGPGHPPSVAILEVGADGLDARHETLGPRGSVTGPQP
ncbi:MAG: metallophosphoesterase family protein, partial [Gemmatimonadota bacterium]